MSHGEGLLLQRLEPSKLGDVNAYLAKNGQNLNNLKCRSGHAAFVQSTDYGLGMYCEECPKVVLLISITWV